MKYAMVSVPVAPIRKGANHRLEMTNQLFFGEAVRILLQKDDTWVKVESLYDGYRGWITAHQFIETDESIAIEPCHHIAPQFLNTISWKGQIMQIPLGASLPLLKNKTGKLSANSFFDFKGKPIHTQRIKNPKEQLIQNAMQWLNAPYLWGGKTIMGVDCSGFSQTMYKLIGRPILRDARQQVLQGTPIRKLQDAQAGDLAFFDDKDEIVHVGILLSSNQIIHASGKVRIDNIDRKGIIHSENGKRTHQLKTIRRIIL